MGYQEDLDWQDSPPPDGSGWLLIALVAWLVLTLWFWDRLFQPGPLVPTANDAAKTCELEQ